MFACDPSRGIQLLFLRADLSGSRARLSSWYLGTLISAYNRRIHDPHAGDKAWAL